MAGFGDWEPEDSWHPDDPPAEQIRNLGARLELVDGRPLATPPNRPLFDALDELGTRSFDALELGLSRRQLIRLAQLLTDIGFVRGRLA